MQHEKLFRDASVGKVILKTSVPAVLSILVMMIYNMADMFFIGQSGDAMQVAAVSLVGPVMSVLSGLGTLVGSGGCAAISNALGKKELDKARSMSSFCCWVSLGMGVAFMAAVLLGMPVLLGLIGASANTAGHAKTYLSIVILGAPFMIFSGSMGNVVRGEGAMKESMLGNILGTVTNLLLDPILISVVGLGIAGAAIATVAGNVASAVYYVWHFRRKRGVLSLSPKYFTLRRDVSLKVLSLGLPTAVGVLLMSVSSVIRNNYAAGFGDEVVAAMGVAGTVSMIVSMLSMGVAMGVQPVIGYTYGAQMFSRMRSVLKRTTLVLVMLGMSLTLFILFARNTLVTLFVDEARVIALAQKIVLISMIGGPISGLSQLCTTFLQATDKALWATGAAVLRQGVFLLPLTIVFTAVFALNGLIWSAVVADILATAVGLLLFLMRLRQINLRQYYAESIMDSLI